MLYDAFSGGSKNSAPAQANNNATEVTNSMATPTNYQEVNNQCQADAKAFAQCMEKNGK